MGATGALVALTVGVAPATAEPATDTTVAPPSTRTSTIIETPTVVKTPTTMETPSTAATPSTTEPTETREPTTSSVAPSQPEPEPTTERPPTTTESSTRTEPSESEAPSVPETPEVSETPGSSAPTPTTGAPGTPSDALTTEQPRTLEASPDDVTVAMAARVVPQEPAPASTQDVAAVADEIDIDSRRVTDVDRIGDGERAVRQWDSQWVQYDEYYRPVIANPYRDPVKIVYVYQNTPRIAYINPLERIVLEVAQHAAYTFTAVVAGSINRAIDVAVGSFFGGGYYPGYGMPIPPPPPPVLRYNDVPVQVRYSDAVYDPFRVQRVVDAGYDEQQGAQRVLLDDVTPAWGSWRETPSGERMFEVHKTQQFPGLDQPGEGPLPGNYQLRLASADEPTDAGSATTYVVIAAALIGLLGVAAVAGSIVIGRRRNADDETTVIDSRGF
jgi:hypothetical protein